jgi:antitoxin YefM
MRFERAIGLTTGASISTGKGESNMLTVDVNEANVNLCELIEQASLTHKPILITGKCSNTVLLAEDHWKAINETLYLVSIPGMRGSILEGMEESIDEASKS